MADENGSGDALTPRPEDAVVVEEVTPISELVSEPREIDEPGVVQEQDAEAEEFAVAFLKRVARLRGVRVDRAHFLRAELHKRGVAADVIDRAVAESPVAAGVDVTLLDEIAEAAISFETKKSSALSFASGIPGGFAMVGAVPADITQFYVHAFRVMQKVAYVYGWQSFLRDTDDIDDETLGKLAAFLGVMMGVGGATSSVKTFAVQVARPAVQKKVANVALTKTAWYLPMKQTLKIIGVQVTKQSFARSVSKVVPVIGGVVSGGLTFVTLRTQSRRLMRHLREIPPPNVDAAEYKLLVDRAGTPESLLGDDELGIDGVGEGSSTRSASTRAEQVRSAVSGAGSTVRGATGGAVGRVGSALRRRSDRRAASVDGEEPGPEAGGEG